MTTGITFDGKAKGQRYSSTVVRNPYVNGLVQEKRNSSALAMELRFSCTNPSISILYYNFAFTLELMQPNILNSSEYLSWWLMDVVLMMYLPIFIINIYLQIISNYPKLK